MHLRNQQKGFYIHENKSVDV